MRRVLVPMVVSLGLVAMALGPAPAHAMTPAVTPVLVAAVAGKKVCVVDDDRLVELSGLVATDTGYIAVNDSSDQESRERVFFLNKKCAVKNEVSYRSEPRDPEDMALSPDRKTLWIGDIGDTGGKRDNIGLWKMPADGSASPTLYRVAYPDGAKDAEALLIGQDGLPLIITKGIQALVYKPTTALKKGETVPLRKVGEVTLPKTTTANPLGVAGRITVTGAAAAPDGSRVVLRTYADAFEWDVTNGDILAALTTGTPRITPLPDEPWGEAITYSSDGVNFLTVSETVQQDTGADAVILRYVPVKVAPQSATAVGAPKDTRSFFEKLDLGDITALISVMGVFGLLLVGAGVFGIVRARRRAAAAGQDEPDPADADSAGREDGEPVRAAVKVAAVDGEDTDGPDPTGSGGYGRPAARATGAVYGAARVSGGTYQVDQADSGAVRGVDRADSGAVYGVDRADSGAVRGVDRANSGAVYGGGGRPGGAVYGVDRANSGAVRGVDRAPSGDVRGVDRAPSGAVYGGGQPRVPREQAPPVQGPRVQAPPVQGPRVQAPPVQGPRVQGPRVQGSQEHGVPQRGAQRPAVGGRGEPQFGGRRPDQAYGAQRGDVDEARARTGDGYYGGDYPQDGHSEQPPSAARRPAEDPEYDDRGQAYGERGRY